MTAVTVELIARHNESVSRDSRFTFFKVGWLTVDVAISALDSRGSMFSRLDVFDVGEVAHLARLSGGLVDELGSVFIVAEDACGVRMAWTTVFPLLIRGIGPGMA
jgi:hypothetical protein